MDVFNLKTCSYRQTKEPGEIGASDFLQMTNNKRILVLYDYFSRKIFTRLLTT